MKHKFEYTDGTEVKFEDFEGKRQCYVAIPRPRKTRSGSAYKNILVYIDQDTVDCNIRRYSLSLDEKNKIRVGIIAIDTGVGLPKGAYIPYKWDNAIYSWKAQLDNLVNNDLIMNETVADPKMLEKLKAAKQ